MLLRNARLYRLPDGWEIEADELERRLSGCAFRPCGPGETEYAGFTTPFRRDGAALVLSGSGAHYIRLRQQQRILPAAAVDEVLEERIAEFESKMERPVRRRERRDLREQVFSVLLPRALTRSVRVHACLSVTDGWIAVDTTSENRAEQFLDRMRDALGTFPAVPMEFGDGITGLLARIATHDAPDHFRAGEQCFLRDPAAGATEIRYRHADLGDRTVQAQIGSGMRVAALEVVWRDTLTCVISENMTLARLRLAEGAAEEVGEEDPDVRLDADFTIAVGTLQRLIADLAAASGGFAA